MMGTRTHKGAVMRSAFVGPVRTCVGCRQTDDQSALVRLTAVGTDLRVDGTKRAMGRGAYVHPRSECLAGAQKGGFSRSFRRAIPRESITSVRENILSKKSEGSK